MNAVSKLIESFARTTAQRDRDQIDLSVARLLHDTSRHARWSCTA